MSHIDQPPCTCPLKLSEKGLRNFTPAQINKPMCEACSNFCAALFKKESVKDTISKVSSLENN